jgi:hypothetical protein
MQNDGDAPMNPRRGVIVAGAVSLSCGWAAVTLGSYLARRYPGAETPLRLLCNVIGALVASTVWSLVVVYHLARKKK